MSLHGNDRVKQLYRIVRQLKNVLVNIVWKYLVISLHACYRFCYVTGVQTIRLMKFTGRRAAHVFTPVGRLTYRLLDFLMLRHVRAVTHEVCRMGKGFVIAKQRVCTAYRRHPLMAVPQVLMLPVLALRRHRKACASILNLLAPVAAAFVLVSTVNYWSNVTFAISLEYDGQQIGYIADESVFDAAANMATDRVINTDDSFEVERLPKMTIAVAEKADILDEAAVCDKILSSASDSIADVSGLYIDGKFEGSLQSRTELDTVLNGVLNSYMNGSANERAEFIQKVEVVDGLFPISSIVSADTMKSYLTSQTVVEKHYTVVAGDSLNRIARIHDMTLSELQALNPQISGELVQIGQEVVVQRAQPYLRVQVIRTVEYTESIAYQTIKQQDTTKYNGYESVKTAGKEGSQNVVAEVTYVDGVEQSRTTKSITVTAAPVDKVVIFGAKKHNTNVVVGDGVTTGKFTWPLPSCRTISSGYGGRRNHAGIDISGNGVMNKPVVAADGGTVVEVNTSGWGAGYGKYIIIDHGGGYRTMYAHLNAVSVVNGQKVTIGQQIGLAGSTGDSTGAHLHFEIRYNGRTVNPVPYLQ